MELPSASSTLSQAVNATGVSTKLLTVIAPVPLNADAVPWMVGNSLSLVAQNGYSPAADFVAAYIARTRLPVLFVPIPIATPGIVGRFDTSGNTNTSAVRVAVGAYGSLEECDAAIRVKTGGVVGTDQIVIEWSLDDQVTWKEARLGTAFTFTVPNVGHVITFGAGSLTANQVVLAYHSTAPMWDNAGLTAAKTALEAQALKSRAWYVEGAVTSSTVAGYVTTAANAYQTERGRSLLAKCALPDRLPYARLSDALINMTGSPNVTFAEVGAGNDTAVRSAGSFASDGFVTGDTIRITGAVVGGGHNNIVGVATVTNATTLTFPAATADFDAEGPIAGVSMTAEPTITFGDNGGAEDTMTLNRGSWLRDGFRVGDVFTVTGTASNNVTATITAVTDLVINVATGTLAAEVIGTHGVTIVAGQTKAQHLIALNAAFASVTSQPRIDLGHGRARTLSPLLGFVMRRNAQYFDTIAAFQHDIHVATWAVENGPLDGASLEDATGQVVEHDESIDGGALAAGFTCLRTWAEKARGAVYIARSVTRAEVGTILSATENMYVACLAQNLAQEEAVNCVGKNLVLNADGTAKPETLSSITDKIDSTLARNLLADKEGEGPRASLASVALDTDNDLSGVDARVTGLIAVKMNGKIAHMDLNVRVY